MSFTPGMRIGKYELGRKLGEGGFGLVFLARDVDLEREVALKFLHPEHTANAEILRRFLQEARAAAKIVHPGIVTVFECGQLSGTGTSNDGAAYIAMELLNGESLTDRLARGGRLAPSAAIEITRQVASALEAAHSAGIIHRDLKPDNIYICKDPAMPNGERMKVLDFGIAKLAQTSMGASQTRSQVVMGTPVYMSPEQCRSATNIDQRSDIYTLGCILFELVTGKPPFDGEMGELIAKHQMVAPPNAAAIVADIGPVLAEVIAAMLAKDPAERPQTMAAVQQSLAACASGTPVRTPVIPAAHDSATILATSPKAHTTLGGAAGQAVSVASTRSKSRMPLLAGGVVVAALAAGGIVMATRETPAPPASAAAPAAAAPVPAPAPAPVVPPAAPAKIKLEIDATPKAEVWAFDGRLLGSTPYATERAPAEGMLVFVLKAPGYQDQRIELPADKSEARTVELVAVPVAAKPVAKAPAKATTRKAAPKTETPARPKAPLKPGDIVID